MKKSIVLFLLMILLTNLSCCGGHVKNTKVLEWKPSELYSDKEINEAIHLIMNEFDLSWKGCSLIDITYAGDVKSLDHQEWAERHNADETIVLISTFEVDSSGGDGSLNPNSTYSHWIWILVRDRNGHWIHVDHGY